MKALELKNVSFTYEGYTEPILQNANFQVNYGELALLSGYSGEGKSTVLSLISGIIPNLTPGKIDGEIFIANSSIRQKRLNDICRNVGIVLQNAEAQIIQQYVEDEIAFGCENFAFPKNIIFEKITDACKQMQLRPEWKTRTLSGGQKQRLMIAATLATEQKILLLDEPLANLDKAGAQLLMNTLRTLAHEGYAVLIVEHRLDIVLPYVDTAWEIRNQQLSKISNMEEYLTRPLQRIQISCQKSSSKENAFDVQYLGFSVGKQEILKDVSFQIKKGERLLLLGENGSGKTTLMRLLARLYQPTKGTITQHFDLSLKQETKATKNWFKKIGIVYQNPNYQLFMSTVADEILYNAASPQYAQQMLELFSLSSLADRHPQSLSEGQKRRLTIAAIAASQPEVLLLDEPTVGQDYDGLVEMVEILNHLHEKTNNTMITVTHDMRCAESFCDHAVLLENGVIAKEGDSQLAHSYFFGKDFKSIDAIDQ